MPTSERLLTEKSAAENKGDQFKRRLKGCIKDFVTPTLFRTAKEVLLDIPYGETGLSGGNGFPCTRLAKLFHSHYDIYVENLVAETNRARKAAAQSGSADMQAFGQSYLRCIDPCAFLHGFYGYMQESIALREHDLERGGMSFGAGIRSVEKIQEYDAVRIVIARVADRLTSETPAQA